MTHINQRRDTAINWSTTNPVLQLGEVGWERDTQKAKLGDGVSPWNVLDYAVDFTPYATLASPVFTGDPKAPTPATGDNDTSIATTAFVKAQGYITLADLGTTYATLESPSFTGDPKAPTPATGDNDTSIATTAFVKAQGYATITSPTFTGDPKAPTPATGDNDTSIATTAFVKAQGYATITSPTFTGDPKAPTPATGDNDTSIATTAFVQDAVSRNPRLARSATGTGAGAGTAGYYQKVATLSSTVAFGNSNVVLRLIGGVGTVAYTATVQIAMKTAAVLTTAPAVVVKILDLNGMALSDIVAVITANTSVLNTVELYARAPLASDFYEVFEMSRFLGGAGNAVTYTDAALQSALPAGTQTMGSMAPTAVANIVDAEGTVTGDRIVVMDGATGRRIKQSTVGVAALATLASPSFTGDPKAPTPATADDDTSIATTAFVKAQGYAPLANPTFTGDPKAPTPATSDNDTSIATTAFVKSAVTAAIAAASGGLITSAQSNSNYFTNDPNPVPIDGVNLRVTVVFPASGKVRLVLSAVTFAASVDIPVMWSLIESSTPVAGTERFVTNQNGRTRTQVELVLSATPGSSHTYTWAWRCDGSDDINIAGGGTEFSGVYYGPSVMTVYGL